MKIARISTLVRLAAAIAVAGCDIQRKSVTSPTPSLEPSAAIPSLLGTWSTTSATPAAVDPNNSCTNFKWTVTEQSATNIKGTFTATCLGSATINGTGTAQMNGAAVTINVSGDGSMPGLPSCPFNVGGTGNIEGDAIRIPYSGSTCLGPVSGTYNLSRNYIQGPPPVPIVNSPGDGTTLSTRKPTLVINNVQPQVPSDTMQYSFEVGLDASLGNRIMSATVNAGSGTTSYTVPDDLSYGTRYYWRVKTVAAGRSGNFSNPVSFVTPSEPPPQPAGNELDLRGATILNSPLNLGNWPITTKITSLDMNQGGVAVEFSKASGPGRWPDVYPPGWDEPLQYTLGMCLNISSRWHCSAAIQFWHGLDRSGGPPSQYINNWFYALDRWGPMSTHRLSPGETIGFFVCAGDCRNDTTGAKSPVKERSNVVLVPFGNAGGTFRF